MLLFSLLPLVVMLHASSPGCKHRHRLWREVEAEALVAPTQRAWCARGELLSPPHQGHRSHELTSSQRCDLLADPRDRPLWSPLSSKRENRSQFRVLRCCEDQPDIHPKQSCGCPPSLAHSFLSGSAVSSHVCATKASGIQIRYTQLPPLLKKKKNQHSSPKLMKTWSSVIPAPAICIIMRSERRRGGRTGKQTTVSRSSRTRPTAPTAADSSP